MQKRIQKAKCIGRESNPGLAETVLWRMATANFTTKPPMLVIELMCNWWREERLVHLYTLNNFTNPTTGIHPALSSRWMWMWVESDSGNPSGARNSRLWTLLLSAFTAVAGYFAPWCNCSWSAAIRRTWHLEYNGILSLRRCANPLRILATPHLSNINNIIRLRMWNVRTRIVNLSYLSLLCS